jgi:hypothetical protein
MQSNDGEGLDRQHRIAAQLVDDRGRAWARVGHQAGELGQRAGQRLGVAVLDQARRRLERRARAGGRRLSGVTLGGGEQQTPAGLGVAAAAVRSSGASPTSASSIANRASMPSSVAGLG